MRRTEFARELRRHQTDAERKLWSRIRNRQMDGWKFRRQVPFGPYILDFFGFEADPAIEVDGGRYWNGEVLRDMSSVIEAIHRALGQAQASPGALQRQQAPVPSSRARRPLPEGRGEVATADKANQQ